MKFIFMALKFLI